MCGTSYDGTLLYTECSPVCVCVYRPTRVDLDRSSRVLLVPWCVTYLWRYASLSWGDETEDVVQSFLTGLLPSMNILRYLVAHEYYTSLYKQLYDIWMYYLWQWSHALMPTAVHRSSMQDLRVQTLKHWAQEMLVYDVIGAWLADADLYYISAVRKLSCFAFDIWLDKNVLCLHALVIWWFVIDHSLQCYSLYIHVAVYEPLGI